jgi:hypothetical protein
MDLPVCSKNYKKWQRMGYLISPKNGTYVRWKVMSFTVYNNPNNAKIGIRTFVRYPTLRYNHANNSNCRYDKCHETIINRIKKRLDSKFKHQRRKNIK